MEKNFNFTTAFAMRCNAEQFESVEKELTAMGHVTFRSIVEGEYLCTNYAGVNNKVGLSGAGTYQKDLIIETFNRELCLALAAMTDKPDGITGEWWIHIGESYENFTFDKIYRQQKDTINQWGVFIDNRGVKNGFAGDNKDMFRKATADKLIKYFTEAKLEQKQPEFKGQLQGFPPKVVEKMLERQVEQGNKRDVSVFEKIARSGEENKGFDWMQTVEGYTFWNHVIDKKDFDLFFRLYPKTNKPETSPQIEALQKRIEDLEHNVGLLTSNMDKVTHQSEPKRYDIKTLSDIIDCTNESNLDNFLIDFKNLLILAHKAKAKGKKLNNAEFTWIDDGKNDILSYDIFND